MLLLVVGRDHGKDLLGRSGLGSGCGFVLDQSHLNIILQLGKKLFRLLDVGLDLFLFLQELLLTLLQLGAQGFIFAHDALALLAGSTILALQRFVALHDVGGVLQRGEEISQAVRFRDEDEDIESSLLFQGAHTHPIALQMLVLHDSGLLNLDGLLGDPLVIYGKLLLQNRKGFLRRVSLLFQSDLLLQNAGLLLLQVVHALLRFLYALGEFFFLLLQLVDLLFLNAEG